MGVGLDEAGLVEDRLIRCCAYGLGGARDVADEVRNHQARSEAGPVFVTAAHDDLGADPETDVPGRGLGQDTGHLVRRGYPPYRLSIASMTGGEALCSSDESRKVLAAIGEALDPSGILAPGRYRVT